MKKKSIVVIGGGTGTYTVLSGLKKYPVHLAAVVAMADNGGSTRVLREEFGVLPPGSVRPALVALSNAEQSLSDLFNFRFSEGNNGFSGHNFGNLFLTALTKQLGSFERAIEEAGKILNIKGQVLPSTLDDCQLYAELENGTVVKGEEDIDVPKHDGRLRIQKLWLAPESGLKKKCKANSKAVGAIEKADLIVIGPGDLYTSILPNFLMQDIVKAVRQSKGKKAYVCNLMTKFGETDGFRAVDFVNVLEDYIGKNVLDYVIVNTGRPTPSRVRAYEREHAKMVEYGKDDWQGKSCKVVQRSLLRKEGFVRHDPAKLANTLWSLL